MRSFHRITLVANLLLTLLVTVASLAGQSTSQDYPTPVTSNEITGTIKPRDIGDSRLTSYYYQFDGTQGDVFVNIVTKNFSGDIDIFAMNGLRPLTKIVVYADFAESETGRVIYLRKPERMLLRVQGRTPGDEPATFRIKFAGSFLASTQAPATAEPELPSVTAKNESGIRVNSVGTIIEVIPKATPSPAAVVGATPEEKLDAAVSEREAEKIPPAAEKSATEEKPESVPAETEPGKRVEVVVTENVPEKTESASPPKSRRTARNRRGAPPVAATANPSERTDEVVAKTTPAAERGRRRTPPKVAEPKEPDPLEKVNLIVLFKDGTRMERPMSEVLRFTVDKGVLTVIGKDGRIGRYSILDVAKVTIE